MRWYDWCRRWLKQSCLLHLLLPVVHTAFVWHCISVQHFSFPELNKGSVISTIILPCKNSKMLYLWSDAFISSHTYPAFPQGKATAFFEATYEYTCWCIPKTSKKCTMTNHSSYDMTFILHVYNYALTVAHVEDMLILLYSQTYRW